MKALCPGTDELVPEKRPPLVIPTEFTPHYSAFLPPAVLHIISFTHTHSLSYLAFAHILFFILALSLPLYLSLPHTHKHFVNVLLSNTHTQHSRHTLIEDSSHSHTQRKSINFPFNLGLYFSLSLTPHTHTLIYIFLSVFSSEIILWSAGSL